MSEKVLGFKLKGKVHMIDEDLLVPVWLCSESILKSDLKKSIDELEKELINDFEAFRITDYTHVRFSSLKKRLRLD